MFHNIFKIKLISTSFLCHLEFLKLFCRFRHYITCLWPSHRSVHTVADSARLDQKILLYNTHLNCSFFLILVTVLRSIFYHIEQFSKQLHSILIDRHRQCLLFLFIYICIYLNRDGFDERNKYMSRNDLLTK